MMTQRITANPMRCIWCDSETTEKRELANERVKYANKEHIFPESIRGVATLPVGCVCIDCNHRLGQEVDRYLIEDNLMMSFYIQEASELLGNPIGKNRGVKDMERKKAKMYNISAYGGGTQIEKSKEEDVTMTSINNSPMGSKGLGDDEYRNKFSRALHKCAVNFAIAMNGYEYVKNNYKDLISFVNKPNTEDFYYWPYFACYADYVKLLDNPYSFEPQGKIWHLQSGESSGVDFIILMFPYAFFVVFLKPIILHHTVIKYIIENISRKNLVNRLKFGDNILDYTLPFQNKNGELTIYLIKKEVKGNIKPLDGFHLLVKCPTCGQTNSTNITLPKNKILEKCQGFQLTEKNNSWNYYTKSDLEKIGMPVDQMSEERVEQVINSLDIIYSKEKLKKFINIENCSTQCIYCNDIITYSTNDIFL